MELSDSQFEQIVGLITDVRVAVLTAKNEFSVELASVKKELGKHLVLLQSSCDVLEIDLAKVQKVQRDHSEALATIEATQRTHSGTLSAIEQSLEGVMQLSKTNFDMIESINKRALGESGSIHHGDSEARAESGTQ